MTGPELVDLADKLRQVQSALRGEPLSDRICGDLEGMITNIEVKAGLAFVKAHRERWNRTC